MPDKHVRINLAKDEKLVGVKVKSNCSKDRNEVYSVGAIAFRILKSEPIKPDPELLAFKILGP